MTKEKRLLPVRKAVIPAAGLGTRFQPATKSVPKALLPIVDKPAVQYAVEEAAASGIEQVILVVGRDGDRVQEHFEVSFELERRLTEMGRDQALARVRSATRLVKVVSVRQKEPKGLAHAILTAHELVGAEPFAVLLPDDIVISKTPCLKQLIELYDRYHSSVLALQRVRPELAGRYGIVEASQIGDGKTARLYDVQGFVEKPPEGLAPSDLAIVGRYVLTPGVMRELAHCAPDPRGELSLAGGMADLVRRERVLGWRFEGRWLDAGTPVGLLRAGIELALEREDLAAEVREMLRSLAAREPSEVPSLP